MKGATAPFFYDKKYTFALLNMEKKKPSKTIEKILKGLYSAKNEEIEKALKLVPEKGDASLIIPLLELYQSTKSGKIKEGISRIVLQLKSTDTIEPLLEASKSDRFKDIRSFIVSAFWENDFDLSNNISDLTKLAVEGDYQTALEVLTVIENLKGPLDYEQLMEGIVNTRMYLTGNREENKTELIYAIHKVLETFENNQ